MEHPRHLTSPNPFPFILLTTPTDCSQVRAKARVGAWARARVRARVRGKIRAVVGIRARARASGRTRAGATNGANCRARARARFKKGVWGRVKVRAGPGVIAPRHRAAARNAGSAYPGYSRPRLLLIIVTRGITSLAQSMGIVLVLHALLYQPNHPHHLSPEHYPVSLFCNYTH